jgi:asparagine synthase (glutamine-hydrolysing)
MCGIAGVFYSDSSRIPEPHVLSALGAVIVHRGPDGDGYHREAGVGLVHRRLSIIDLTGGGQPMANEDDSVHVVFNGEIYNFQALRSELVASGHKFKTRSDTEVLVHLYEELGERMVERLRGMFAFAIWDRRRRRLFLARDRVGIKPLYICRDEEKLIFASEPKAILAYPGIEAEVDPEALESYLAFGVVPGPRSIFKGIVKLPPAHTLTVEPSNLTASPRRYWRLKFEPDERLSEAEWLETVRDKFEESVRIHMISDVPVGAFLSGGLDSSAVVAVASRASTEPLRTFSVGFREQGFNELPFARAVSARFQTRHHESILEAKAEDLLDCLAHFYDEPFADASAVPTYLMAMSTAEHVKVVLTGDGGDELFGGYSRYAHDLREAAFRRRIPKWVRRGLIGPVARAWPRTDWLPRPLRAKSALTNVAMDADEAHAHSVSQCREPLRRRLLAPDIVARLTDHDPDLPFRLGHSEGRANDPLAGMLAADVNTFLPDDFLVKVDRATMAAGLEARPPLLDHELLEMAARIPSRFKVCNGETKVVFKKVCLNYLPKDVVYRKKHGFDVPTDKWMRGPLRERFQDCVLDPGAQISSLINQTEAQKLFEQHQKGVRRAGQILWSLLVLSHWAERYLTSNLCSRV